MTRLVFEKIARTFVKSVRCCGEVNGYRCGSTVRKQKTLFQTANPFNVHELTKQPKDREQIERELVEAGLAWQRAPELCRGCEESEPIGEAL